jgi:hypothetical protein
MGARSPVAPVGVGLQRPDSKASLSNRVVQGHQSDRWRPRDDIYGPDRPSLGPQGPGIDRRPMESGRQGPAGRRFVNGTCGGRTPSGSTTSAASPAEPWPGPSPPGAHPSAARPRRLPRPPRKPSSPRPTPRSRAGPREPTGRGGRRARAGSTGATARRTWRGPTPLPAAWSGPSPSPGWTASDRPGGPRTAASTGRNVRRSPARKRSADARDQTTISSNVSRASDRRSDGSTGSTKLAGARAQERDGVLSQRPAHDRRVAMRIPDELASAVVQVVQRLTAWTHAAEVRSGDG